MILLQCQDFHPLKRLQISAKLGSVHGALMAFIKMSCPHVQHLDKQHKGHSDSPTKHQGHIPKRRRLAYTNWPCFGLAAIMAGSF